MAKPKQELKEWDTLMDALFELDKQDPFLGQTVENVNGVPQSSPGEDAETPDIPVSVEHA